jgi:signal transduction histidine kinase
VAIPLVVLLSAVGGYALAVRSFRPVVAMAETARRLEARDLRERLPVQNSADELGKLAQTINHLLDRISTVIHGQRDFMADAAHDLRTPVSIARTAAQTALEQPSADGRPEREALGLIEHQMARVSRMVSDLLFLARSDSGEIQLRREAYYLDELLRELEGAATVLCRPKGLVITTASDADVQGAGDVHLLQQMLLILVENAIQHSPASGRIQVTARRIGSRCEISVADQGPGIPPADRARIFDRFYRGRQGEGTGLGLAIATRIARAHGGTLTLADNAGPGSVFRVEIALTV